MSKATDWKVPKWPFFLGDACLLIFAGFLTWRAPHPIGHWEIVVSSASVALGAVLGVIPFILEYQATARLIEVNGLETVVDKIQQLDELAGQISACTNDWNNAQTQAEKTASLAKDLTSRMGEEVRHFGEFMTRMNDGEKAALRLEVEKLRRSEGEWLQVLVRILDNVFSLHAAAEHSGQPRLAAQIGQFQTACHDAARRVGLTPFAAEPDEPFHSERHQAVGLKEPPPAGAVVAETVGPGFKYQGKLLRPALVRLRDHQADAGAAPKPAADPAQNQLPLEADE
jgi:molecular chaperone GrpE (heat shock protein)